jgi:hypothetical protein
MIDNKYLDWFPIIDSIDNHKNLVILELGCGRGTLYLLDKFKYVYSYETNSRDIDGNWFKSTYKQCKDKNWTGYFDSNYPGIKINVNEFKNSVLSTVDISLIDVLFIDPGFADRAKCAVEFTKLLHFKYIFVHDTNTFPEIYNWQLLNNIPIEYKLHTEIKNNQGTKLFKLSK